MRTMWVRNSLDYVAGQAEVAKVVCEIGADADDVGSLEILDIMLLASGKRVVRVVCERDRCGRCGQKRFGQTKNGLSELVCEPQNHGSMRLKQLGKSENDCWRRFMM